MDSLANYGSDDEGNDRDYSSYNERSEPVYHHNSHKRSDDTNYDDVTMDMSEESNSEQESTSMKTSSDHHSKTASKYKPDKSSGIEEKSHGGREKSSGNDKWQNEKYDRSSSKYDDRRKTDKSNRDNWDRNRSGGSSSDGSSRATERRGLLGDRPDSSHNRTNASPPKADSKNSSSDYTSGRSRNYDNKDYRYNERSRDDRDRERRDRDRDKETRHSYRNDRRSRYDDKRGRSRSRSRDRTYADNQRNTLDGDRKSPGNNEYSYKAYKVNKKLNVMEKMGLQIKTPDGSMATAQDLRLGTQCTSLPAPQQLPKYYNPNAVNAAKILDQVQKRKLLWSHKTKKEESEANTTSKPETSSGGGASTVAKWSGAKFAQDNDGKQVSKFMRLMGIKDPDTLKKAVPEQDVNQKQEELFQAMQAQYEVARATTHTMRGVGLGFGQRQL